MTEPLRLLLAGGAVGEKRYDPLWEIVDEKVALQGQEPDIDVPCPYCHVLVRLSCNARVGERFACGLCGGVSGVADRPEGIRLAKAAGGVAPR
jgi:hypothetical protein